MAKKTRRKHFSDKLASKSNTAQTMVNRFELKFTKEKYQVLGRKRGKSERGAPTVSRAKANEERLKTLGNQMRVFGKSNKFVDRRLGERDAALSNEEKMVKRFALERQKRYGNNKRSYRLDDDIDGDVVLTHYGQSLSEIEQCVDKPLSDDEEPNLHNANIGDDVDGEENSNKSRKSFIDEMVAKSKQLKHEKQAQREHVQDLTDKLDEQWRTVLNENLMSQLVDKSSAELPKLNVDDKKDYDVLVRELLLDRKKGQATATDRLKTEEEIAKEEFDKLEKQETERRRRMKGDNVDDEVTTTTTMNDHINPDDDDTNLHIVTGRRRLNNKTNRNPVTYADGKYVEDHSDGEEDEDDDDNDDDDDDSELSESFIENENEPDEHNDKVESRVDGAEHLLTNDNLPFVLEMPKTYSALKTLLFDRTVDQKCTILERLIKCLHPSLRQGNKQRLQRLYLFLLRYFDEVCCEKFASFSELLTLLDKLGQFLFKLASYGGEQAGKCAKILLKKHYKEFNTKFKGKRFPAFNVFAYLRLIPKLFSCSDFWHPIATPSLVFASNLLDRCRLKTTTDLAKGLLLCFTLVDFVKESKRYVPAIIGFLEKIVDLHRKSTFSLETSDSINPVSLKCLFDINMQNGALVNDDDVKFASILYCSIKLSRRLLSLWSNLPSLLEIFEFLTKLSTNSFPEKLKNEFEEFSTEFEQRKTSTKKTYLKFAPKPEKEMKFLEPRIETNFNPEKKRRKTGGNDALQERQRLLHKYKREYKSAARELRRDNEFLARQQFQERARVDMERTEKTKRLMSSLMGQEADYKKLKRMKKD